MAPQPSWRRAMERRIPPTRMLTAMLTSLTTRSRTAPRSRTATMRGMVMVTGRGMARTNHRRP